MNVIFLDFDGVIDTVHFTSDQDMEEKIKILSRICHKYNCKVVIESSYKDLISEDMTIIDGEWIKFIFSLFKKYDIECIGRTPTVPRRYTSYSYAPIWKEDEIRLYLFRHPEIEHYCVIDDDDLSPRSSDLNKVREHLLTTLAYSENKEEEGLLEKHDEQIGQILKKENKIRKLILKYKK